MGQALQAVEKAQAIFKRLAQFRPDLLPLVEELDRAKKIVADSEGLYESGDVEPGDLDLRGWAAKISEVFAVWTGEPFPDPEEVERRIKELEDKLDTIGGFDTILENELLFRALLDAVEVALALDGTDHYLNEVSRRLKSSLP